jgi:hypothetical protein
LGIRLATNSVNRFLRVKAASNEADEVAKESP